MTEEEEEEVGLSTNMPSCCSYIHLVFSFIAARDHGQRWPRRQRVAFQSLPTNTRMTSDLPLDSFTAFPSHYTPPASSSPATRTERQCHCQPEKQSGRVQSLLERKAMPVVVVFYLAQSISHNLSSRSGAIHTSDCTWLHANDPRL